MQWSQIKTLFILCFLILNIYLFYLVIDKQKEADIGVIEREDTTIEERLESENITYKELPEVEDEEPFLSVEQKQFDSKDKKNLDHFNNQQSIIVNDNLIVSMFEDPISIPDDARKEAISGIIKGEILYSDEFEYWNWNEEYNILVFFQEKNDRPVYFNRYGVVLVFLNEKDEAIGYIQSVLGETEEGEEKKSLIQPIKAIETLYLSNQLNAGEEVTNMKMGYHTRVPLSDGVQVFVPTWKVNVDKEWNYFINAIEGFTFSGNDGEFLHEALKTYDDDIRHVSIENKDIEEMIIEQLDMRIGEENGSEE